MPEYCNSTLFLHVIELLDTIAAERSTARGQPVPSLRVGVNLIHVASNNCVVCDVAEAMVQLDRLRIVPAEEFYSGRAECFS